MTAERQPFRHVPPVVLAFARAVEVCPTDCDDDCEAACHETHFPTHRRDHQPDECPSAERRPS